VTSTNYAIVVYNHGMAIRKTFFCSKSSRNNFSWQWNEDDEIDINREVGTRSDDDFILDQEELSDTEDHVETIENSSSEGDSEAEQDQPADNAADTVSCCRVW
jgi:hypothetical protein